VKQIVLVLFIIYSFPQTLTGQSVELKIFKKSKEIGSIVGKRTEGPDSTSYIVHTNVNFSFLVSYDRKQYTRAVLRNDRLHQCQSKITVNDDLKENKFSHFSIHGEHGMNHGVNYREMDQEVKFSTIMMYFHEPKGIDQVFSESFQEFCQIEKLPKQSYKLTLPNGEHNIYRYHNERLVEVDVQRTWFDLTFVPVKVSP
jgi:hypothetical protein